MRKSCACILSLTLVSLAGAHAKAAEPPFVRGQVDADPQATLADSMQVLGFLFLGEPKSLDCLDAADTNDSGLVDISDPIYFLQFLFLDGIPPPPPFPDCGPDTTGDALDCLSYPACPAPPDREPPAVELSVPPEVFAEEPVKVSATATDNVGVASVEFLVGGERLATLTVPPYETTITFAAGDAGKQVPVTARARDAAGNSEEKTVQVRVLAPRDRVPPTVVLAAPESAAAGSGITLSAQAQDDIGIAGVDFFLDGKLLERKSAPPFEVSAVVPSDPGRDQVEAAAVARDAAGNEARDTRIISITFPSFDDSPRIVLSGPARAAGGETVKLIAEASDADGIAIVRFLADGAPISTDEASPFEALFAIPEGSQDGARFLFTAVARDRVGREGTAQLAVVVENGVDESPPVIDAVGAPAEVAAGASFFITARVRDDRGVERVEALAGSDEFGEVLGQDFVEPYSISITAPGAPGPLDVRVRARDAAGNTASRGVTIQVTTVDPAKDPVVRLIAPAQAAAGSRISMEAQADDEAGIESVTFFQGLSVLAEDAVAPYRAEFTVPADAIEGSFLGFRARARSLLGRTAEASAVVRIVPHRPSPTGGEVYAIENGDPLAGAEVEVVGGPGGPNSARATSDALGRYSLLLPDGEARLRIRAAGRRDAFRAVNAAGGAAVDVVSAHLPLLPAVQRVPALAGAALRDSATGVVLEVDAASLAQDADLGLGGVHAQALPDLLPLGWSPLVAVAVEPAAAALGQHARLKIPGLEHLGGLDLLAGAPPVARYDAEAGRWIYLAESVEIRGAELVVEARTGGVYAVLASDRRGEPPLPAPGAPLPGLEPSAPTGAAAAQVLPSNPVIVSSRDEINDVRLLLTGLGEAPSGTVVRVESVESYRFLDGSSLALETFARDLVLHRRALRGALSGEEASAAFFIAPRKEFEPGAIEGGRIDLAVFEPARADLPQVIGEAGGSLSSGGLSLELAAGALTAPVALRLLSVPAGELPAVPAGSARILAAARLEASGLGGEIEARFTATFLGEEDGPVLVLEAREIAGRTLLVLVGEGSMAGGVATAFIRVRDASRWALARAAAGSGRVEGILRRGAAPAEKGVVTAEGSPIASVTGPDGAYRIIHAAGAAKVRALVPETGESAAGEVTVESEKTATLDLLLEDSVPRVLSIVPLDGEKNVSRGSSILLTFSEPAAEGAFGESSVTLAGPGGPVAADYFLLPGGVSAAIRPRALLDRLTTYQVSTAEGLRNRAGVSFLPAASRFTTLDDRPPKRPEAGQISMSMPDDAGRVLITGTQGSVNPGAAVAAMNLTSGVINTVVAGEDGSFQVRLDATRDDRVKLLIRDPSGAEVEFFPGLFDSGDGTAVMGADGGVMTAPDGTQLLFQPGSFEEPTQVKFERFEEADSPFPIPGDFRSHFGFNFAAGFTLDTEGKLLEKNVKLRIPLEGGFTADDHFLVCRLDEVGGEKTFILEDDAQLRDGILHIDSEPHQGVLGNLAGLSAASWMVLIAKIATQQDVTFVTGRVISAPLLGVLTLTADAEVLIGTDNTVIAEAQGLIPGVTVSNMKVEKEDTLGAGFGELCSTGGGTPPSICSVRPGVVVALDPVASNDVLEVFSIIRDIVLGQKTQRYRAKATFSFEGRDFEVETAIGSAIVTEPFDVSGAVRSGVAHVFKKGGGDGRPVKGAFVEAINGIGRSYPTVTLTQKDGTFVLAVAPDAPGDPGAGPPTKPNSFLRIFDPVTGQFTQIPMVVPSVLFEFVDAGEITVPETLGDTRPPLVNVQLAGSFRIGEFFTGTVIATDEKSLALVTADVNGIPMIKEAISGTNVTKQFTFTPFQLGDHKITARVSDSSGNSVKRETIVRIGPAGSGTFSASATGEASLIGGSVNIDQNLGVYVKLSNALPGNVTLESITGLDIHFEVVGTGTIIKAEGGVISRRDLLRIRPRTPLPLNSEIELVIGGVRIRFFTGGVVGLKVVGGFQEIRGIAPLKQHLFVADFGDPANGLKVVDMSDLENPTLLSGTPIPVLGGARGVRVVDEPQNPDNPRARIVVIGGGQSELPTLKVFNVNNPAAPVRTGNVVLFPFAEQAVPVNVRTLGTLAYVCTVGAGVQIVDVDEAERVHAIPFPERNDLERNGASAILGGFRLPDPDFKPKPLVGSPFDVALEFPGLVITGGGSNTQLFVCGSFRASLNLLASPDFNNPFRLPKPISRVAAAPDFIIEKDVTGDGLTDLQNLNLVVVSHTADSALSLVDLTNPSNPVLLSTVSVGGKVQDLAMDRGFIFTGDRLVTVLDPAAPAVSRAFEFKSPTGEVTTMTSGGDAALARGPVLPGASHQVYLALSSTDDRKSLQIATLIVPVTNRDWDVVRTSAYEPKLNPDNEDYLKTGDPVNPFTGEFVVNETDLAIPGRGISFAFTRTYRSQNHSKTAMGFGWDHNYNARLTRNRDTEEVILMDGLGRVDTFTFTGGSYTSPPGTFSVLKRTEVTLTLPAGVTLPEPLFEYDLQNPDGSHAIFEPTREFSSTRYRLKEVRDRFENRLRFSYNSRDFLIRVRDSMSRDIDFTYDSADRIIAIKDWEDRRISYEHDFDDNLIAVTGPPASGFPNGKTTRYTYEGGFFEFDANGTPVAEAALNHNLLEITDPKDQTYLKLTYFESPGVSFDRVRTQTLGCPAQGGVPRSGGEYEYSYTGSGDIVSEARTFDRRGHQTRREYSSDGHLERLHVQTAALGVLTSRMEYDPDGLLEEEESPRGVVTEYDYRGGSNRLRQADLERVTVTPSGGGTPRITRFVPGPFGVPTLVTDAEGHQTHFTVDNQGRVTRVEYPNEPGTPAITECYSYGALGQIESHTSPDGTVARYSYFGNSDPNGDGTSEETQGAQVEGEVDPGPGYLRQVVVDTSGGCGGGVVLVSGAVGIHRGSSHPPYSLKTTYDYDPVGNITAITDPRGNTVIRELNTLNQVVEEGDSRGHRFYTYDENDNLQTFQDLGGRTFEYEYDCLDNLVRVEETGVGSRSFEFEYDESENRTIARSPLGNELKTEFDERGLPLTVETRGGPNAVTGLVHGRRYDRDGNLTSVEDADGHASKFTYDGFNRLLTATDPNGNRLEYEYDRRGLAVSIKRFEGANLVRQVFNDYDKVGRLKAVRERMIGGPRNGREFAQRFEYDAAGRITTETDPLGNRWQRSYDSLGRLASTTDPSGNKTLYTYDGLDLSDVTRIDVEDGGKTVTTATTYRFDGFGRVTEVSEPLGRVKTFVYDNRDLMTSMAVAGGETISWSYDSFRRLTQTKNGREQIDYTYDDGDRLLRMADASGRGITTEFDGRNRVIARTFEDGSRQSYGYSIADDLLSRKDRAGNVFAYQYDDGNRLRSFTVTAAVGFEGTTARRFTFDGLDRMTSAIQEDAAATRTVDLDYDSQGVLLAERQGGRSISYSYDDAGRGVGVTYPSPGTAVIAIALDPNGRAQRILDRGTSVAEFGFSGPFVRLNARFGNGTRWNRTLNAAREEIERRFEDTAGGLLTGFRTDRNKSGRISVLDSLHEPGRSQAFSYTNEQWLSRSVTTDGATSEVTDFAHDASGNLASRSIGGLTTSFTANSLNQYSRTGGTPLEYDLNGNLRGDGRQRYQFDALGQLRRVTNAETGAEIARYDYDGQGRRVREATAAGVEEFIYSGANLIAVFDGSGALKREYLHGEQIDRPLLLRSAGRDLYFHYDVRGNVVSLCDATGAIVEKYRYDDQGNTSIFAADGSPRATSAFGNRHAFKGAQLDPATGIYCMRARDYHPALGRFLQPDPAGTADGLNLYTFAGNDPVGSADPSGLFRQASADNLRIGSMAGVNIFTAADLGATAATLLMMPGARAGSYVSHNYMRLSSQLKSNLVAKVPGKALVRQQIRAARMKGAATRAMSSFAKGALARGARAGVRTRNVASQLSPDPTGFEDEITHVDIEANIPTPTAPAPVPLPPLVSRVEAMKGQNLNLRTGIPDAMITPNGQLIGFGVKHINKVGGVNNCPGVSISVDSWLAGRPASATWMGTGTNLELESLYGAKFTGITTQEEIIRMMSEAGPGARGIIRGDRGSAVGHVFNVLNDNGAVKFIDAQPANTTASFEGFTGFQLLRTDQVDGPLASGITDLR